MGARYCTISAQIGSRHVEYRGSAYLRSFHSTMLIIVQSDTKMPSHLSGQYPRKRNTLGMDDVPQSSCYPPFE